MTPRCEEVWPPECVCGHDVVDHDHEEQPEGAVWLCAACDCGDYTPAEGTAA